MLMVRKSVCLLSVIFFALSLLWFASCTHQVVEDEGDQQGFVSLPFPQVTARSPDPSASMM